LILGYKSSFKNSIFMFWFGIFSMCCPPGNWVLETRFMTLKTPCGHDPSIPNFGPIYSFFIWSLSLSLCQNSKDVSLSLCRRLEPSPSLWSTLKPVLHVSVLLSNSCSMSLICSQAHAPWLTTKLRWPKTLLTPSRYFGNWFSGISEAVFLWFFFFFLGFF